MLNSMVITKIVGVFTVNSPKGRAETVQNRRSFGISLCYGGQITYYQNGNVVVSDRNHLLLLPQGKSYAIHGDEDGLFPVINVRCAGNFTLEAPTAFPLHHPETYLRDYERLRELYLLRGNQARCMSLVYGILGGAAAESETSNPVLRRALEELEQHYADPTLTNEALAAHCHLSEVYFRRLFKEAYHTTPKQYILELRLRKARQLLAEGRLSVGEIAEQCGFSSVYHFSRAFRQAVGCTPTAYAENARRALFA